MNGADQQLMQVAIAVHDLDSAIASWSAFLGMPPSRTLVTGPVEEAGTTYRGAPTPARVKLALFELGAMTIELMEPVDGPSVWADHLAEHGQSIHHLGFKVRSMEESAGACENLGFGLAQEGDFGTGRYAYFDSESQLGTTVEFLEFYEPEGRAVTPDK